MKAYTPVIIIGAGRSGTNMLRDIITSIDGFKTWDCDEINPIWRYGNRDFPTDELPVEKLSPRIKKYIRGRFNSLHKKTGANFIVEKTCANSLRLNYVHAIFPNAKYIIINRDGRDVVPSAMKRWVSSFELKYTLKKLRYVPITDLSFYIWRFGFNRLKKIFSNTENLAFWGPLYSGIEEDVKTKSLLETCANQWQICAEKTIEHREYIYSEKIFDIKYEEFVSNPMEEMKRLSDFFEVFISEEKIIDLVKKVTDKSVGSHKRKFSAEEIQKITKITKPTLKKLNYSID
ncbi:MAG TPA: sulfotransferase [Flavobacteriaceae bacterium]|nr:sulfotransferase [Flavobacteriaceae bacterium]